MSPDLFRIQTRLPLRPSTNMSHTTNVKHTGYQVNIIHHEVMFQVTINDIVQYICQCRIRPPNRAGGNATRHGTDANSGDGWVGSCVDGVTFGAWSKSGASSIGVRTACSNTDAGPAVPAVATLLRCTDGIPSAHVRNRRNPFRPLSLAQSNESEPVWRPSGLRE